jgi:2-aminoadipate transaminase
MNPKITYTKAGFDENTISDYIEKYLNQNCCYNFGWGSLNQELIKNPLPKVEYDHKVVGIYNQPKGQEEVVKEVIKFIKSKSGKEINPGQIMLTNGATNGIFLLAHYFTNVRKIKKIIIQSPVFDTALNIFNSQGLEKISISPDCHDLPKIKNSFAYLIFKFQNPSGVSIDNIKKQEIIKELTRNGNYLIEDDAYGLLVKGGKIDLVSNPNYIFVGSFSKYIFPGLRLGFIVAEPEIISDLQVIQKYYNSHPNVISQYLLLEYIKNGLIESEIKNKIQQIKERRKLFEKNISNKIKINLEKTNGGFYYWLKLSKKVSAIEVFTELLKNGIVAIPGDIYFANTPYPSLRLCISLIDKEKIKDGCKILNEVLEKYLD